MNSWGKSMLINLYKCNKQSVTNKVKIQHFTKTLVKRIDMEAYGEPEIIHFGKDNKKGYSLNQFITTSNITGHFCDDTGHAFIDIFSCKDFCPKEVEKVIDEFFQPEGKQYCIVERDAKPDYE